LASNELADAEARDDVRKREIAFMTRQLDAAGGAWCLRVIACDRVLCVQ
jgi:hypothetical protein